ncbi:hypothetical protein [Streptomyces himastatinicus]|uniref:hypothetical protein n=1 Tax=Streptomyces himastatinicus TaxID=998084 RepID=UPI00142F2B8B|nr:hypothetical protein [Streptomyces himastatinicus]
MECPAALVAKWAPGAASFEAIDERITRIQMGAWSWSALIGFLITFDCRFTVEGPARTRRSSPASEGPP